MMDDALLDAFRFPHPSRAFRALVRGGLKARGRVVRLMRPRTEPFFARQLPQIRSYPDGYAVAELGTFPAGCPVPHPRSGHPGSASRAGLTAPSMRRGPGGSSRGSTGCAATSGPGCGRTCSPGSTVAAYLVPQVMAYAEVAGLPPIAGLWAIGVRAALLRPARLVAAALGRAGVDHGTDDGRRRRAARPPGTPAVRGAGGRAGRGRRRHVPAGAAGPAGLPGRTAVQAGAGRLSRRRRGDHDRRASSARSPACP